MYVVVTMSCQTLNWHFLCKIGGTRGGFLIVYCVRACVIHGLDEANFTISFTWSLASCQDNGSNYVVLDILAVQTRLGRRFCKPT